MTMQPRSILFAEDYRPIADTYREFFKQEHFDVTFVSNGREALQTLLSQPSYTILRTDYNMPQMDGLELLQRLRLEHLQILQQLRVVVKSGNPDEPLRHECRQQREAGVTIDCLNSMNEFKFWNALIHGNDRWQELVEQL